MKIVAKMRRSAANACLRDYSGGVFKVLASIADSRSEAAFWDLWNALPREQKTEISYAEQEALRKTYVGALFPHQLQWVANGYEAVLKKEGGSHA